MQLHLSHTPLCAHPLCRIHQLRRDSLREIMEMIYVHDSLGTWQELGKLARVCCPLADGRAALV